MHDELDQDYDLTDAEWDALRDAERIAYAPTLVSSDEDDLPF